MTTTHAAGTDFRNLWVGGWLVRHRLSPYSVHLEDHVFYQLSAPSPGQRPSGPLPYLPWVTMLFAPLSYLSTTAALWIWDAVSLAAVGALTWVWARTLGWDRTPATIAAVAAATSTIACYVYLLGQLPGVSLALFLAALSLAYRGHHFWSGAAAMAATLISDVWTCGVRRR
ncbi:MAG: glycosyltransferase 87 family protein, partial [Candidatus Dormibacteria bacterium]